MSPVFVSVVIPAYNEAARLLRTLRSVLSYLGQQPYRWEVVVVNDGSTDATAALTQELMVNEPNLQHWQYGKNRGKGYAVRYGMSRVTGQYRLFMDADNSTTIDHVEKFLPYLKSEYDIAIGSRDITGAEIPIHQPRWKERLGDLGNLWIQWWAVPGIKDTQAGFKMFTDKAALSIFPYLTIERWGFDVEVLAVARLRGLRVIELPIRWTNDPGSKVTAWAYLDVLREVVQIHRNIVQGVYAEPDKK